MKYRRQHTSTIKQPAFRRSRKIFVGAHTIRSKMTGILDEDSLRRIEERFKQIEAKREGILKDVRDVTLNSSKAIIAVHTGKMREAEQLLEEARRVLLKASKLIDNDLQKYMIQPAAEYVEASIAMAISRRRKIPTPQELEVEGTPYLLGVLDAIGEAKRMVYDCIREGKVKEAIRLFKIMEAFYTSLTPFAAYDHIAQGIRRKIDVARILIEGTRAVITEEVRRSMFIKELQRIVKEDRVQR